MTGYSFFKFSQILTIFLTINLCYAQELPQVIPPTPNAASLGQYVVNPVGNYTGIPDISIPLYTIKSGEIELPITLSYHASGIKVAQEASWVGLGWALNAGGIITRQIMGQDDFGTSSSSFIYSQELPPSTSNNGPYWTGNHVQDQEYIQRYNNIYSGAEDGEPDMYYFNFMGNSGKMVIEKQSYSSSGVIATVLNQNNIKVLYKNGKWEVTDGNGWKFYFETIEQVSVGYETSVFPMFNEEVLIGGYDPNGKRITGWYLNQIITPRGDSVTFVYDSGNNYQSSSQVRHSEKRFYQSSLGGNVNTNSQSLYSMSQSINYDVYLREIHFNNGKVIFTTEDRHDIRKRLDNSNTNMVQPQRLKAMEVFDIHNKSVKKVELNYSYFNSLEGGNLEKSLRLKLDSVQELYKNYHNNTYLSKPPYGFTYNESVSLPKKTSYSIDHWGFYNGADNYSVPQNPQFLNLDYTFNSNYYATIDETFWAQTEKSLTPFLYSSQGSFFEGGNREPHSSYMQAWSLKSINYPTGGKTNYTLEPNWYSLSPYESTLYNYASHTGNFGPPNNNIGESTQTFTLLHEAAVLFTYQTQVYSIGASPCQISPDPIPGGLQASHVKVSVENSNGKIIQFAPPSNKCGFATKFRTMIPPGTYTIRFINESTDSKYTNLQVLVNRRIPVTSKIGGGLRAKSIEQFDYNDSPISTYNFKYTKNDGNSSGRLLSALAYFSRNSTLTSNPSPSGGYIPNQSVLGQYATMAAESLMPISSSANGSHLGYDQVTISKEDTNGNSLGESELYFKNNMDAHQNQTFHPGVPSIVDLENGQITREEFKNDNGIIVKEIINNYTEQLTSRKSIKGVKVYLIEYNETTNLSTKAMKFYDVFSEWHHPESTTEISYDINGENPVSTTSNYYYDNPVHKNRTRIATTNSEGQIINSDFKYPSDLINSSNYEFSYMHNLNILNPIIEKKKSIDTEILETQFTEYSDWISGQDELFLPETFKYGKGTDNPNFLIDRIIIHKYDLNGNPLEVSKAGGMHIVYIWGYNKEYPIAKIENSTYSEISSHVINLQNLSNVDDDRTIGNLGKEGDLRAALTTLRNALSDAMVTTYTYDPLVGVTSIADPKGHVAYYEYDSFLRLKQVRDQDGNILSESDYNYKH